VPHPPQPGILPRGVLREFVCICEMALRALFLSVDTDGLIRELSLIRDHDKWILGSTTEIINVAGVTEKYSHTIKSISQLCVVHGRKLDELLDGCLAS